jgi:primosomal protein N' (replication factor Y)
MIIFVTRRGLASETVCGDCGTIVTCHHCKSPVVLHKSSAGVEANFFLCHVCGERRSAHEKCVICTSWKLVPLGIGIERVEDEIMKLAPSLPCLRLDSDSAKTSAAAEKVVKRFSEASKGVLLGTEMLLHQTIEPADTSAIVSLDSLFAVPDFRIHEKVVHLILAVRGLSKETFLLQTRNPEEELLHDAITGHLANFYRREIALREQFHYPPFSTLIKVTVEGTKDSSTAIFEQLIAAIQPQNVSVFPAFVKTGPKKHALHGLIKVPRGGWPDKKLGEVLTQLPRNSTININPESVF